MKQKFTLILFLAGILFACNDDDNGNFLQEFRNCDDDEANLEERVEVILPGKWEYFLLSCPMTSYSALVEDEIILEFKPDQTMIRTVNGSQTSTHTWSLEIIDGRVNSLVIEPKSDETRGAFFICNDRMAYQNSFADGCDYYFRKDD